MKNNEKNDAFKICQEYGYPLTVHGIADCSAILTEALVSGIFFSSEDYEKAFSEAMLLTRVALKLLEDNA